MSEQKKKNKLTNKHKLIVIISVTVLIVVAYVLMVYFVFDSFKTNYEQDTLDESALHLADINRQIRGLVQEDNKNTWKATESITHSILTYEEADSEEMLDFIRAEQEIWNIDDVLIITESGDSVRSSGKPALPNDVASQMAYTAVAEGRLIEIEQSTIACVLPTPADSTLTYNGSRVVAVASVKDLSSFLDDMKLSSFNGSAFLYLTEGKGASIAHLTRKDAAQVTNAYAIFEGHDLTCLVHDDAHTLKQSDPAHNDVCVYLDKSKDIENYVVVTSIDIGESEPWLLFYIVPSTAVNETMTAFSERVTNISVHFIVVIFFLILGMSIVFYAQRGKKFEQELASRIYMFDLLVSHTQNAFGLLRVNEATPLFASENIAAMLGGRGVWLHKEESCYGLVVDSPNANKNAIDAVNEELKLWDGKATFSSDYLPYTQDDKDCYFVLKLFPDPNDTESYVIILLDITKERERENALRSTLVLANSANVAKTRFLANMSHDIRTPMNAIVNMTNFAIENIDEKAKLSEYLSIIRDSSAHLLNLINDILDMSRIESGKMVVEAEPFDITETLSDVEEIIKVLANQKRQEFIIHHDIKTPRLLGDRLKVSQILLNLLTNAVKYTPEKGTITFTATEIHSLKSEFGVFRFSVKDTGSGIDEAMQEQIFDPFVRTADSKEDRIEGTGLGLSICRSYVEAMGGFITVTSHLGQGSIFTAELHFNKDFKNIEVTEKPINQKPDSFAGKRVLLVEDNAINRKVATMVLNKLGFEVETANNGQLGYNKFIASENGYYDLIYMDVQMPVMNGYEATAAIRDSVHPQAHTIPILAMTANVFAEDVERSRVSGMDGHIGKPIVVDELVKMTEKVLADKGEDNT